MGLEAILIAAATRIGAPIVKSILQNKIGGKAGEIGGAVIDAIAGKAGVAPEELPDLPPKKLDEAVAATEAEAPEMIALWARGLEGQFALLQAEQKEAWYQSAWRWGWMYLLAVFWTFYILVFPIMASAGFVVERVEASILLTLTTWFISLYMGGHTVKALGESAINAVRSWRGKPA
ncbi:MAG: hypothetical protein ABIF45_17475 [Pseudomonadota bacterium]